MTAIKITATINNSTSTEGYNVGDYLERPEIMDRHFASEADAQAAWEWSYTGVDRDGVGFTMSTTAVEIEPEVYDYATGKYVRPATLEELIDSERQATRDGGAGVILLDGRSCYVSL